nr:outer membrane beta-barrel protein [Saprospiraceae bacterium]
MRILGFCLLFFTFIHWGNSQTEISDFVFGFEAAPAISWINTDDNRINSNGPNLGLRIGTRGEFILSENYSLTSGILFSFNQGGQVLYEQGGRLLPNSNLSEDQYNEALPDNVDIRYKIQFLEIPFGFKMRTNQIGNARFYAHFPEFSFAFRTGAKANLSGGTQSTYTIDSENENIKDEVPFFRFKWGVSIGAEYQIGSDTYLVGGMGYQSNFGDILKGGGTRTDGSKDNSIARVHAIVFQLGVMF